MMRTRYSVLSIIRHMASNGLEVIENSELKVYVWSFS